MKTLTQAHIQFKDADVTTCRFVQVARCTNVYTFDLARSAYGRYGDEASELGFMSSLKISRL